MITVFDAGFLKRGLHVVMTASVANEIAIMKGQIEELTKGLSQAKEQLEARTRELTEALEQRTAMSEILRVISNSPTELQSALDALATSAARFCGAEDVSISRLEGDNLMVVAHCGPISSTTPVLRGTVIGRCVRERRAVHVEDLQAETEAFPEGSAFARKSGFRTIVGVPLLREGTPLGAILLRRTKVEPFSDKQIVLLQTFAEQAVIAVENTRLFEEVQARNRDLAALLAHVSRLTTMGELAASIGHELSQPLAAILISAQTCLRWLARDRPDLDEARQATERIVNASQQACDIIKSIRALARKSSPEIKQLDINEAIREVLVLMRGELGRHNVSLETSLLDGLEPVIGDRVQLQQVILNLIVNGIEAMTASVDHPRLLRVSSQMDGHGNVLIAVEDTGAGLDPTKMDRIFDAFFTTKPGGIGIGLSICRSIVEGRSGRLWASPTLPYGSVFRFTLPANSDATS